MVTEEALVVVPEGVPGWERDVAVVGVVESSEVV